VKSWRRRTGVVRHVFTHFPLELAVLVADVPASTAAPDGGRFVPLDRLDAEALPTLMRKVIAYAFAQIRDNRSKPCRTHL
jgi:A/G-specific adenine glycosylase